MFSNSYWASSSEVGPLYFWFPQWWMKTHWCIKNDNGTLFFYRPYDLIVILFFNDMSQIGKAWNPYSYFISRVQVYCTHHQWPVFWFNLLVLQPVASSHQGNGVFWSSTVPEPGYQHVRTKCLRLNQKWKLWTEISSLDKSWSKIYLHQFFVSMVLSFSNSLPCGKATGPS